MQATNPGNREGKHDRGNGGTVKYIKETVPDTFFLHALLNTPTAHHKTRLTGDQYNRLTTWMDTYAQRQGSFSPQQEKQLKTLRHQLAGMLTDSGD